jgi:hypothetical protein
VNQQRLFGFFSCLFHYTYYAMVMHDGKVGSWSPSWSRNKAIFIFFVVETWMIFSAYLIVARISGWHARIAPPTVAIVAYVAAMLYGNHVLLIRRESVGRHKAVFDGWSEEKRLRWNVLAISVAVSAFAVFMLLVETSF